MRRAIDKFERDWKYDAIHIRDLIDASPRAAWLFSRTTLAALVVGTALAAPAAAQDSVQPAAASCLHPDPAANRHQHRRRCGADRRGDRWWALAGAANGRRGAIVATRLGGRRQYFGDG